MSSVLNKSSSEWLIITKHLRNALDPHITCKQRVEQSQPSRDTVLLCTGTLEQRKVSVKSSLQCVVRRVEIRPSTQLVFWRTKFTRAHRVVSLCQSTTRTSQCYERHARVRNTLKLINCSARASLQTAVPSSVCIYALRLRTNNRGDDAHAAGSRQKPCAYPTRSSAANAHSGSCLQVKRIFDTGFKCIAYATQ